VLIIDDDEDVLELLALMATQNGFEPWKARDCREGIELVRRAGDHLALVLLDYFMPGMKPVECCQGLRSHAGHQVEIVLVTAAVNPAERARALGLQYYIGKPFDLNSLEWVWSLAKPPPRPQ
jgi:DNA-binding response OmpR family regulator